MDKLYHLIAGTVVAAFTYIAAAIVDPALAGTMALLATAVVGAAKEARDSLGYGHVEFMDFVATVIPGLIVFLLL